MIYWIAFILWAFQTISSYVNTDRNFEILSSLAKSKYPDVSNKTFTIVIYIAFTIKAFMDVIILKLFLLVL